MALKSRGLQMIDQALADMRAGRLASDQNQQAANDRYMTQLMATLPPSQRQAALLANPNWQKTGKFTIPDYQPTDKDKFDAMVVQDNLRRFPTLRPEQLNAGTYQSAYGATQSKELTEEDINRQNMTPTDFADTLQIAAGRKMNAKDLAGATETNRHNTTEEGQAAPVRSAQAGLYRAETGKNVAETGKIGAETSKLTTGGATAGSNSDAAAIADAIVSGKQPPDLKGMYKQGAAVRAELARRGYDLTQASQDWTATQKYLSTLNGQGQVRLRQAVDFSFHSLDIVDGLAQEWSSKGLPLLSKANLKAARSGAYGADAQSLATRLDGQIGDMVSELAVVYKGGNSPTDEGLKLAAKNLQADWSYKALHDNVGLVKQNLTVRRNSITSAGVVANSGNQYSPNTGSDPASASPSPGTSKVIRYDASGKRIQ